MNQHQKYHKAKEVTSQLASLTSEGGMDQFRARLVLLKTLRDRWTRGDEVTLGCCLVHILCVAMYSRFSHFLAFHELHVMKSQAIISGTPGGIGSILHHQVPEMCISL